MSVIKIFFIGRYVEMKAVKAPHERNRNRIEAIKCIKPQEYSWVSDNSKNKNQIWVETGGPLFKKSGKFPSMAEEYSAS